MSPLIRYKYIINAYCKFSKFVIKFKLYLSYYVLFSLFDE